MNILGIVYEYEITEYNLLEFVDWYAQLAERSPVQLTRCSNECLLLNFSYIGVKKFIPNFHDKRMMIYLIKKTEKTDTRKIPSPLRSEACRNTKLTSTLTAIRKTYLLTY